MYEVVLFVEEQKKDKQKVKAVLEGADRKELLQQTEQTICDLVRENGFKNPTAEYVLSRDGMYIDGEIELKVKVNRNGVSVKLGELII